MQLMTISSPREMRVRAMSVDFGKMPLAGVEAGDMRNRSPWREQPSTARNKAAS